jgi:hypothetical protein
MIELCCYDGLPCDRFIVKLGFSACYVKSSGGKLSFVCSRFKLESSVSVKESLVPKGLIPI